MSRISILTQLRYGITFNRYVWCAISLRKFYRRLLVEVKGGSIMSYKIREDAIPHMSKAPISNVQIDSFLSEYRRYLLNDSSKYAAKEICSGLNRMKRSRLWCCESVELKVYVGDIVYLDYGHAYLNEAGYQHFGLIMSFWNNKALVIPMTSNKTSSQTAINVSDTGRCHLYYIGYVNGLSNHSTLFLNDAKMINTARIISVNGHIKKESSMFKEIRSHLINGLF